MRRFLTVLMLLLALQSCAVLRTGKFFILDHQEQAAVLQSEFPQLFALYQEGRISVDEMYMYKDRKGRSKYHVSYKYFIHVHDHDGDC